MKKKINTFSKFIGILCIIMLTSIFINSCGKREEYINRQLSSNTSSVQRGKENLQAELANQDEEKGFNSWVRSAAFKNGSAWVVTQADDLLYTNDSGKGWRILSNQVTQGFKCIAFVSETEGVALNAEGAILKTSDAGLTWKKVFNLPLKKGEIEYKTEMKFADQLKGILIISPGYLWKTSDGGMSWQELYPFEATKAIRCALTGSGSIKDEIIWLTAEPGILFKSEDSGKSWSFQKIQNSDGLFYDIFFINKKIGWLTGFPSLGIFRTNDSGNTWKSQLPFVSSYKSIAVNSLYFINEKEGWAVGQDKWGKSDRSIGRGAVLHTTDGGQSWKQVQVGSGDSICSWVYFTNSDQGWIIDRKNIYHTNDSGITWVLVKSHLPSK